MAKIAMNRSEIDDLIATALAEDIGSGDITSIALIRPSQRGRAVLVARERGVLAGIPVVRQLLARFDRRLKLSRTLKDGARLQPGSVIAAVSGPVISILAVERTLLNFVQRLSGIATVTSQYADAITGTGARLLDTRKTLPGWRRLAKYAVAMGGGKNHRAGLYDQVLIKDNHLAASGLSPVDAVSAVRAKVPRGMRVEVEVETVGDARAAALAGADIVMLDNMSPARMKRAVAAVRKVASRTIVEASGRITLRNIASVARTGVDWISVGALTHSAKALDIALEMETD